MAYGHITRAHLRSDGMCWTESLNIMGHKSTIRTYRTMKIYRSPLRLYFTTK